MVYSFKNMKNKKNKLILSFLLSFFCLFSGNYVLAGDYGLNATVNEGKLKTAFNVNEVNKNSADNFLSSRVGIIIGSILSFIGVMFMLLIIYGGILWMTAMGKENQVEKAKNIIIQAVIGLVIVLAAYAITAFIGNQLTGSTTPISTSSGETVPQ
jgi:cbb3-type cytochrome oxidase subunit 3